MKNIDINPKNTEIAQAVKLSALYSNVLFRVLTFSLWILGIISTLGVIAHYLSFFNQNNMVLGFMVILSGIFLGYLPLRSFYFTKELSPNRKKLSLVIDQINKGETINLFDYFSFTLARSMIDLVSRKEATSPKKLFSKLFDSDEIFFILVRLGIRSEDLLAVTEHENDPVDIGKVALRALEIGAGMNHDQIEVSDFFASLCEYDQAVTKFLGDIKTDKEDMLNVVYWQSKIKSDYKKRKGFFNPDKLKLTGGVGRDWAYGWTPYLKQFSIDLSKSIKESGLGLEIIGHETEIKQIEESLLKQNGGNAIIVGEPGVGKNTTVIGFVKEVVEGKTNSELDFKHIVKVDTNYLLSGSTNPGEVTNRISGLLSEAGTAGNIIIYFENFQNLISSGDAGKIDATEVLLPFLDQSGVHVIATCDVASYNQYIATNSALNERLTRITIEEPSINEMIRILEDVVPTIEYKTKSIISYEAIESAIRLADKYIVNLPNPEKSINLLDGATARAVSERGKTIVLPRDIEDYISEKYQVPAGDAEESEKQKLLSLEDEMHKSVIGQTEAISAIANAMRRTRAGIVNSKKPIGSFLFLGPTGVGKTETAKALTRTYFGDESRMIRFDMSEYQNKEDIYRLIGSNLGNDDQLGLLSTQIREHPFSLLLFDEIEKAHPDILDLFLQILDEGFLTDGSGRKVSFSNSIIIDTSNAGANLIRESIQSGVNYDKIKENLLNYLQKENIFRPEFINRFSGVIAFSPLSLPEITQVANLMITKMIDTIRNNKGITVQVQPEAIEKLAKMGFDPKMGARPMARVIEEKLENLLAKKILSGELKNGDSISIGGGDIL